MERTNEIQSGPKGNESGAANNTPRMERTNEIQSGLKGNESGAANTELGMERTNEIQSGPKGNESGAANNTPRMERTNEIQSGPKGNESGAANTVLGEAEKTRMCKQIRMVAPEMLDFNDDKVWELLRPPENLLREEWRMTLLEQMEWEQELEKLIRPNYYEDFP